LTWIIVGLVESRSGDVEILPDWCIGKPNGFNAQSDALTVRESMQAAVDAMKSKTNIRYIVLPAIDDGLITQLHGTSPPAAAPKLPTLSFGPPPRPPEH
jgi:hypothetical protein